MSYAELQVNASQPATYRARPAAPPSDEAVVEFHYFSGAGPDLERQVVTVASRADDAAIGWDDPEGVQAVAQAILRHFTGEEPDQALLEALVTEKGDDWTASPDWTLDADELRTIVDHE